MRSMLVVFPVAAMSCAAATLEVTRVENCSRAYGEGAEYTSIACDDRFEFSYGYNDAELFEENGTLFELSVFDNGAIRLARPQDANEKVAAYSKIRMAAMLTTAGPKRDGLAHIILVCDADGSGVSLSRTASASIGERSVECGPFGRLRDTLSFELGTPFRMTAMSSAVGGVYLVGKTRYGFGYGSAAVAQIQPLELDGTPVRLYWADEALVPEPATAALSVVSLFVILALQRGLPRRRCLSKSSR